MISQSYLYNLVCTHLLYKFHCEIAYRSLELRWLSVAEMYQDKDEFERTKEYVEDFRENQGPKLQRFLQQK